MVRKDVSGMGNGWLAVTFELPATVWAGEVAVVGEFNGWNPTVDRLTRGHDGTWRVSLQMERNRRYRFGYLVDGTEWLDEPFADGYVPTRSGGRQAILIT